MTTGIKSAKVSMPEPDVEVVSMQESVFSKKHGIRNQQNYGVRMPAPDTRVESFADFPSSTNDSVLRQRLPYLFTGEEQPQKVSKKHKSRFISNFQKALIKAAAPVFAEQKILIQSSAISDIEIASKHENEEVRRYREEVAAELGKGQAARQVHKERQLTVIEETKESATFKTAAVISQYSSSACSDCDMNDIDEACEIDITMNNSHSFAMRTPNLHLAQKASASGKCPNNQQLMVKKLMSQQQSPDVNDISSTKASFSAINQTVYLPTEETSTPNYDKQLETSQKRLLNQSDGRNGSHKRRISKYEIPTTLNLGEDESDLLQMQSEGQDDYCLSSNGEEHDESEIGDAMPYDHDQPQKPLKY